jgi:hypothetical protein
MDWCGGDWSSRAKIVDVSTPRLLHESLHDHRAQSADDMVQQPGE